MIRSSVLSHIWLSREAGGKQPISRLCALPLQVYKFFTRFLTVSVIPHPTAFPCASDCIFGQIGHTFSTCVCLKLWKRFQLHVLIVRCHHTALYFYPDNFKSPVEKRKEGKKRSASQRSKDLCQKLAWVLFCVRSTLQAKAKRKAGLLRRVWKQEIRCEPGD